MHSMGKSRAKIAIALCAGALLALPAPAGAVTVLLGPQDLSASDPFATCDSLEPESCKAKTFIPTSLPESGGMMATPADGTIVSWRVKGAPPAKLRLRVVQPLGGGQYKGISTSGVAKVSDGASDNTTAISIAAGNQVGIDLRNTFPESISSLLGDSTAPGGAWNSFTTGLADGATGAANASGSGSLPLFNATVVLHKPLLFSMTSTEGPQTGGDIVVVNGIHLAIVTSVTFGGVPATIVGAGPNQIMVTSPAHEPGVVNVAVHTAGGASDESPISQYRYNPVLPPPPDTAGPKLTGFAVVPVNFRARKGARITYRSDEAGTVKFTLQRKKRRGPFAAIKGSFRHKAKAGRNQLRMPKRISKKLRPGRYKLVATATDELGNKAKPKRRPFRVIP